MKLIFLALLLTSCNSNRIIEQVAGKGLSTDPTPYGIPPQGQQKYMYGLDFDDMSGWLTNQYVSVTFSGADVIEGRLYFTNQTITFKRPANIITFDLQCDSAQITVTTETGTVNIPFQTNITIGEQNVISIDIQGTCWLDNLTFADRLN